MTLVCGAGTEQTKGFGVVNHYSLRQKPVWSQECGVQAGGRDDSSMKEVQ